MAELGKIDLGKIVPSFEIVSTTVAQEGEAPEVTNLGTGVDVKLDFKLPHGEKGAQGEPGKDFAIAKVYDSVADMTADFDNEEVPTGALVVITVPLLGEDGQPVIDDFGNTETDVSDPDNAKLYVKGETEFQYMTDMSGTAGIQGPQGWTFTPSIDENGVLSWTNNAPEDKNIQNPDPINVKGIQGEPGLTPYLYIDNDETSDTYGHLLVTYEKPEEPKIIYTLSRDVVFNAVNSDATKIVFSFNEESLPEGTDASEEKNNGIIMTKSGTTYTIHTLANNIKLPADCSNMFSFLDELVGYENLDTSGVTSFNNLFNRTNLTTLDLSAWDVSNCEIFSAMFAGSSNLTTAGDIVNWPKKAGAIFNNMFTDCPAQPRPSWYTA